MEYAELGAADIYTLQTSASETMTQHLMPDVHSHL